MDVEISVPADQYAAGTAHLDPGDASSELAALREMADAWDAMRDCPLDLEGQQRFSRAVEAVRAIRKGAA